MNSIFEFNMQSPDVWDNSLLAAWCLRLEKLQQKTQRGLDTVHSLPCSHWERSWCRPLWRSSLYEGTENIKGQM